MTHSGAAPVVLPTATALAPVVARSWKRMPLAGVATTSAKVELAFKDSRIMTPALAAALAFPCVTTWAMIVPSPMSG